MCNFQAEFGRKVNFWTLTAPLFVASLYAIYIGYLLPTAVGVPAILFGGRTITKFCMS